jgi:hypothetical protein
MRNNMTTNNTVALPLSMTMEELDRRISLAMTTQSKYTQNSNFHLQGFDTAKIAPTVKAVLLAVGLVEITPN